MPRLIPVMYRGKPLEIRQRQKGYLIIMRLSRFPLSLMATSLFLLGIVMLLAACPSGGSGGGY